MQSQQIVDMNEQRQQSELLKQNEQIKKNTIEIEHEIENQFDGLNDQVIHQENNEPAEVINNALDLVQNIQDGHFEYPRTIWCDRIKIICDFLLLFYFIWRFYLRFDLPFIGNAYSVYYLESKLLKKQTKQVDRSFIAAISLWPIFKFIFYGLNEIYVQEKVFLIVYSVQLIPILLRLSIACCILPCTCFCTICCICCCALDKARLTILKYIDKFKYKRIKEELCTKNLALIEGRQCTICLLQGNLMATLDCQHSFHPVCLRSWIDQHKTCPNCRLILY